MWVAQYSADPMEDVTLMTQLTLERMLALEHHLAHWPGPLSVALFLPEERLADLHRIYRYSSAMQNRTNLGLHVVFRDLVCLSSLVSPSEIRIYFSWCLFTLFTIRNLLLFSIRPKQSIIIFLMNFHQRIFNF